MTQLPGILSKAPLMGSLCPSSLCHALMDVSEVLKHTSSHSVLSSRKPKSCHRRSQHRVRGVKNAGERWAAQFCKGHVIKISSNHGSATKYLLFFFPSVLVQAAVPAHSDFWESSSDPSGVRHEQPSVLEQEQEQLMNAQQLIINQKKSLATRHRLISANQSCFPTRLSKRSCC